MLYRQKAELDTLRGSSENYAAKMQFQTKKNRDELQAAHSKFMSEKQIKTRALQQLEEVRHNMVEDL